MPDNTENRLQHGEIVVDPPELQRANCGRGNFPHAWTTTCLDGPDGPAYFRVCQRCGAVEVRVPGQAWAEAQP